jgi:hypothetical protein
VVVDAVRGALLVLQRRAYLWFGPDGGVARTWRTRGTVMWIALFLAAFLILYYLR